jgi:hypothetical protein
LSDPDDMAQNLNLLLEKLALLGIGKEFVIAQDF